MSRFESFRLKSEAMKRYPFILIVLLAAVFAVSCARPKDKLDSKIEYTELHTSIEDEHDKLNSIRESEMELEDIHNATVDFDLIPIAPEFNPLDETRVTFEADSVPLNVILFSVAKNCGLNLMIEPGISLENTATVSFEDEIAAVVVRNLLRAYDLAYEVEDNVLYVKKFEERSFKLNFLDSNNEITIESGGDVKGGSSSSNDLAGTFKLNNELQPNDTDSVYGLIEEKLDDIFDDIDDAQETYMFDRMGGVLHISARPSVMRRISSYIESMTEKLSKQVLIDAQILEVQLNDDFRFGIDWNVLNVKLGNSRSALDLVLQPSSSTDNVLPVYRYANPALEAASSLASTSTSTQTYTGSELITDTTTVTSDAASDAANAFVSALSSVGSGTVPYTLIQPTITALQEFGGVKAISNPHVRARHGHPALFMSGTSESYVSRYSTQYNSDGNPISQTPELSDAFSGIMLGVIPFINDDQVDLQIFPIKSDVLSFDEVDTDAGKMRLPTVSISNVNTNLRVHDNDTIIIGGIINKKTTNTDTGIPGLQQTPLLGWAFKEQVSDETVTEMVIIMHIRIL